MVRIALGRFGSGAPSAHNDTQVLREGVAF
jgi:hypothetical protein